MSTPPAVIIDAGSEVTKAGIQGQLIPDIVFPTVVGWPKLSPFVPSTEAPAYSIGDAAISRRGLLKLTKPVEYGTISHWDGIEAIWGHIFSPSCLDVDSSEQSVVLMDPYSATNGSREGSVMRMFETFNVSSLYSGRQPLFSLWSQGKATGCVVESGAACTWFAPIENSTILREHVTYLQLGGNVVDSLLASQLAASDVYHAQTSAERDVITHIKETMSYIADDCYVEEHAAGFESKSYELADGQVISIGSETFRAPEVMFNPSLAGFSMYGIHHTLYTVISKCPPALQPQLFSEVWLSGGNSLLPGLPERLTAELANMRGPSAAQGAVNTVTVPEFGAWIGASFFASLSTFPIACISKVEYDEIGPTMVHRKCP